MIGVNLRIELKNVLNDTFQIAPNTGPGYNHIYEGRSNLFGEVISEEDEDEQEDENPSRAFMWSEAVVPGDNHNDDFDDNREGMGSKHLLSPSALPKRSKSESDLGKILVRDLQNFGRAEVRRLPASARKLETKSKRKKVNSNGRSRVLGSVGQLLATFRSQKSRRQNSKPVLTAAASTPSDVNDLRREHDDVTTFV